MDFQHLLFNVMKMNEKLPSITKISKENTYRWFIYQVGFYFRVWIWICFFSWVGSRSGQYQPRSEHFMTQLTAFCSYIKVHTEKIIFVNNKKKWERTYRWFIYQVGSRVIFPNRLLVQIRSISTQIRTFHDTTNCPFLVYKSSNRKDKNSSKN